MVSVAAVAAGIAGFFVSAYATGKTNEVVSAIHTKLRCRRYTKSDRCPAKTMYKIGDLAIKSGELLVASACAATSYTYASQPASNSTYIFSSPPTRFEAVQQTNCLWYLAASLTVFTIGHLLDSIGRCCISRSRKND